MITTWTTSYRAKHKYTWTLHVQQNFRATPTKPGIVVCLRPHSPLGTNSFALATRGAKATRASKTMLGEQIGKALSLPRIGSLGGRSTKLCTKL